MWVYKITNLINQKCYVGITNNIYKRWIQHKSYKDKKEINLYTQRLKNTEFQILNLKL